MMQSLGDVAKRIPLLWRLGAAGLLLALVVTVVSQARPDGRLHLLFFPVGQGNAVLIVTPAGQRILLDGGPDPTALLTSLGRYLPFWQRALDVVLLSETHPDRMAGPIALLERYRVAAAACPPRALPGEAWNAWQQRLAAQGVQPQVLTRGSRLSASDGVTIEVLYPPQQLPPGVVPAGPDDSLALRLRYGAFAALLLPAAGPAAQQRLGLEDLDQAHTLLLLPQQAGWKSLDGRFLERVRPAIAIVSAGTGYHQGADARTLDLVRRSGATLYRTDRQGTIEVVTDGRQVWVRTGR